MHVNDTFGQAMQKGFTAVLPRFTMPFKVVDTIAYDPAARDLSVEVSQGQGDQAPTSSW
jgi:branched-chain amino acid transport system substrate-binding protein